MNFDLGLQITEEVFRPTELTPVVDALRAQLATRSKAGARHVLAVPAVRALAEDERLLRLADRFVGSARPFRATLFDKSAEANWLVVWHQDTALPLRRRVESVGWGPWSVKAGVLYAHGPASALAQVVALRVHLDDSTEANGPLRVLPNTHRLGLVSDAQIEQLTGETRPVACLAAAGGVLVMRPLIVHASSKSRSELPRRVLHIEYTASVDLGRGIELAVA